MRRDSRRVVRGAPVASRQLAEASQRVKQVRAQLGLSQRGLAVLLGVSPLSVLRWERGHTRPSAMAWRQFDEFEATRARSGPVDGIRPAASHPLGVHKAPTNLPLQLSTFIGREAELEAIERCLSTSRLVTLTGAGGCGKTRLALTLAGGLTSTVDARNSYWNSATGPTVASNPGGTGDTITGSGTLLVLYQPFSTTPVTP